MNINNLYEIYFSPTGGTKEAVEVFGAQWNIAKAVIDLTDMNVEFDQYEFYNDDLCIIGVPSFSGRAPAVAIQRIKELKGNNTPVVIIATYGNRAYEDTLIELQQVVEESGFCVVAALAVVTQHSIIPQYGTGRPDDLDRTRLVEMSIKVKVHIERARGFNVAKLADKKPLKEYSKSSLKPSNVGRCISCGVCARNCPVGAIPLDNPKETDAEKCIACMRCVNKCPKDSRKVSDVKVTALATRIRKECLSRKEIEIFVNTNLNNSIYDTDEVYENAVDEKDIINNEYTVAEEIEEISVSEMAMEDAIGDVNTDGVIVQDSIDKEQVEPVYERPAEPVYERPTEPVYERPAEPVYERPVEPVYERPTEPVYERPTEPVYERPTEPVYERPAEPVYERPTEPVYERPIEPVYERPAEPVYERPIEPVYERPIEPVYEKPLENKVEDNNGNVLPNTFADMQRLFGQQSPHTENQEEVEEINPDIARAEQLEDIPDDFVLPEPEEITMPENMKGVSLDDIDNDPYELDEDLLDEEEIDEILELDEITEQERPEVENPKDFVLNISEELEDIVDDVEEVVEEIEDEIGIILEDT